MFFINIVVFIFISMSVIKINTLNSDPRFDNLVLKSPLLVSFLVCRIFF